MADSIIVGLLGGLAYWLGFSHGQTKAAMQILAALERIAPTLKGDDARQETQG